MPTVVMVHGAFCGGWAFESFRAPFEARGWTVLAPDLPGHEPGASPAGLSMRDYARSVARLCEALPERPVLLGHSMGGLVCQLAARQVQPSAMALLAPSPPWGVPGSSLEEAITAFGVQVLDPFFSGSVTPDRHLMRHHSLDRVPKGARRPILERLRPESSRALREVLNWWMDPFMTTSVGLGPLPCRTLALVGDRDVVHPAATVRQTAERIGAQFQTLPGMSHWLVREEGWEEVAGTVVAWLDAALSEDIRRGSTGASARGR